MAAISSVPSAAPSSALTPPSSSHGGGSGKRDQTDYRDAWDDFSSAGNEDDLMPHRKTPATFTNHAVTNGYPRSPLTSNHPNAYSSYSTHAPISRQSSREAGFGAEYATGHGFHGSNAYRPQNYGSAPVSSSDSLTDMSNGLHTGKRAHAEPSSPVEGSTGVAEASKWIHRDKLARIESEELQAAGIILPPPTRTRSRSRSRPRGTRSESAHGAARSRKNSMNVYGGVAAAAAPVLYQAEVEAPEDEVPSWDLRSPEEIAEEAEEAGSPYWISMPGSKGASKIPVAKLSPAPIPADYIERESPASRKRESSPGEDIESIKMPRARARSSTASIKPEPAAAVSATPSSTAAAPKPTTKRATNDTSPKKAAARKTSGPKTTAPNGRPKTRGGPSKDSSSSGAGTRPTTRSGERELSPSSPGTKHPEGDPPWMISAYKPDPRLPPDQQLLPTVARRLQQEKWEREGKFGSVYDKEFRPLTDDGLLSPPDRSSQILQPPKDEPSEKPAEDDTQAPDWPLKAEPPKSPGSIRQNSLRQQRTGSYSTIPKVQDSPVGPIPGSRGNAAPGQPSPLQGVPTAPEAEPIREKKKEKAGCMCCIVM